MGALSKKLERIPVSQKYILFTGPASLDTELIMLAKAPEVPAFKIAIAGMIVMKYQQRASLNRKPSVFIGVSNFSGIFQLPYARSKKENHV